MKKYRYLLCVLYSKRFHKFYFFNDYDEMFVFLNNCGPDIEYITYYLEEDMEGKL